MNFYKDKKVFITGHTGFKGAWLSKMLVMLGANVKGYALKQNDKSLYNDIQIEKEIESVIGDIRDFDKLKSSILEFEPEIVFHLAAQPIVLNSYKEPKYTFDTNVIGTVNLFEALRECKSVKSIVNVTTDKVYKENENGKPYKEEDSLMGYDPYSASKACSEIVTNSYRNSFFNDVAISTCRAGNVIGGGDYSDNRIIPDCVRAVLQEKDIVVRNPNSIRPYQHVLEALFAYLLIAKEQYLNSDLAGEYNIGPESEGLITTEKLVTLFCNENKATWISKSADTPHEAS